MMATLVHKGFKVASFKVGPDFIDPGHHGRITGMPSRNLDGWMLSETYNRDSFARHTSGADVAVLEGVMGLFDGYDGKSEAGSTAQMAKWLGLPVLLVVDAKSMARSVAALVHGFESFDENLRLCGILFNNVGSTRHLEYLEDALAGEVKTPCLGGVMRDPGLTIPERHLGLITRQDHPLTERDRMQLVRMLENSLDINGFLASLPPLEMKKAFPSRDVDKQFVAVRLGVAMDSAFCFYYQDNLDLLANAGAELIFFSPLSDRELPPDLDGLYLGGGYPELFAGRLSANAGMMDQIRQASRNGMPIYGECGGFMYLGRYIDDLEGKRYPMAGCLPATFRMLPRRQSLGYREVTFSRACLIGKKGQRIRGHEFHYSERKATAEALPTCYHVSARGGRHQFSEGFQTANTLGSYMHLHFGSAPTVAEAFVGSCLKYKNMKESDSVPIHSIQMDRNDK